MSTFDFKIEKLCGTNEEAPEIFLINIDNFKILANCGWNYSINMTDMEKLIDVSDQIDVVIITSSNIKYMGFLPYLYSKCQLKCPVYMTYPTCQAGKLFLYDFYQALDSKYDSMPFSLDDIDNSLEQAIKVRYLQKVYLKGKGQGVSLMCLNSGVSLGGCVWKICKDDEGDIVFAPELNHKKQFHLNEAMIQGILKPYILITNSCNYLDKYEPRKERINKLTNEIKSIYNSNYGTLLLYSDTAGNVLELLFIISNILKPMKLANVDIALTSHVANHVLKLISCNIEWLNEKLMKKMENGVFNFLGLLNLYTCQTIKEVSALKSVRLIIASDESLNYPIGLELFSKFASNAQNTIIFTSKPAKGTLSHKLLSSGDTPPDNVTFELSERVLLEGTEFKIAYENAEVKHDNKEHVETIFEDDIEVFDIASLKVDPETASNFLDDQVPIKRSISEPSEMIPPTKVPSITDESVKLSLSENITESLVKFTCSFLVASKFSWNCRKKLNKFQSNDSNKRKNWDLYGDVSSRNIDFLITEKNSDFVKEVNRYKDVEQEKPIFEYDKLLTKRISRNMDVSVNAKIVPLYFDDVIDSVSHRKVIESIRPRHIILIGTDYSSSEQFETDLNNNFVSDKNNSTVHNLLRSNAISLCNERIITYAKLNDKQIEGMKFVKASNGELSWIKFSPMFENKSSNLKLLISQEFKSVKTHSSVYVNTIKINELCSKLKNVGIDSVIEEGIINCVNGNIKISKDGEDILNISAVLCPEYLKVRKIIQREFIVV